MKTAIPIVIALAALIALMACNPADEDINKSHDDKQIIIMPMMMPNNQIMYMPLVVGTVKDSEQVSVTPDISEPEIIEVAVEDPEEEEINDTETGAEESYQEISENGQAYEEDDFEDRSDAAEVDSEQTSQEGVVQEGTVYLGAWTITAYCGCPQCCGGWSGSPTASGAWPSEGWTVACGSLPFGSIVYIEGLGTRCVEDRGVYGDWIDVYFDDHDAADSFGMQSLEVYLVE